MTVSRDTVAEVSSQNQPSQKADLSDPSTWWTKPRAAKEAGVTTKTLEKWAQDGHVAQTRWRRPTGGPELVVYFPDDVRRMAQARRPGPSAVILPADGDLPTNGNGHHHSTALQIPAQLAPGGEDIVRLILAAAHRILTAENSATSENSEKLFLTVDEAASWLNWTPRDLRRAIRAGEVPARNKERRNWRTWRIKRTDLECL